MRRHALALLVTLAPWPCAAQLYRVDVELYRKDGLLAKPALVVAADTPVSLSSGPDYTLGLVVSKAGDSAVLVELEQAVDAALAEPRMVLELGKQAAIQIGDLQIKLSVEALNVSETTGS